jgi:hypothetical protein
MSAPILDEVRAADVTMALAVAGCEDDHGL